MTELKRRAGELDWELERGMGTSEMGVLRLRRKDRAVIQVEKDGQNMRWKIGELGILCQEVEQGVDSKSYVHKVRGCPFEAQEGLG